MAMKKAAAVAAVRGTRDLWPKELAAQQHVVNIMQATCSRYGYAPIQTPMLESTDLYTRSLGTTSDIVSKEMYTFRDHSNNSLTLRPECTAGVIRSMLSNGLQYAGPHKVLYSGSMFRYERPQRGRYREFQQFGVEYIGSNGPHVDIDVLAMANDVVRTLGLDLTLQIHSLGCLESRKVYRDTLTAFLAPLKRELSADSQHRFERGSVLRILDSKDARDRELLQEAPRLLDSLTNSARTRFDVVLNGLAALGIESTLDHGLVRGLDYYSHTVFEFIDSKSGLACLAGGCYDHLVESLGGPATSCIGWAAGVERLTALSTLRPPQPTQIAMVPVGNVTVPAMQLAASLRSAGHTVHWVDYPQLKKQMKVADQFGCTFAVLVGEDEVQDGVVTIKHLEKRTQETVAAHLVVAYFDDTGL
ncbi:histidine-tRNA ligase [Aphanomyces invadans]|uniref:histidine--tRNA ligase n=1 Tax=Aphanomyces invadans TaxID=157072 RepID=A0A024TWE5_9STRA|nr:histidine-tRNA ligase [Aphanomyces invadans]ETV97692.1 histidine-tRNA ligase [Aphanomyces invadans]|eukprot:XP_008873901.1 histidine-tRNA ligase [Aphanomyces invadans]